MSAPSGSGKTTVLTALLKRQRGLVRSVSMTTRPPRRGERRGRDYHFVARERFLRERAGGGFLEWAKILGHLYGTPRGPVLRWLRGGRDVILGIDIRGSRQVRASGLPVTTIFLVPPSFSTLRQRLRRRGTETGPQVQDRLRLGRREMKEIGHYDYAVVNDDLEEAVEDLKAILRAEHCRVKEGR